MTTIATEKKITVKVNNTFISVNSSDYKSFTQIMNNSGQEYTRVNQTLWDALEGYEYDTVNKAIQKHMDEINIDSYDFADNFRYAVKYNEDSEKQYEDKRHSGCCGSYDTVITVDTSSDYQNSSIDILFGFNYGH